MTMEFQTQTKLQGDEIYTAWYYRSRPVVGAFGAMIMYVIISAPAFYGGIDAILSKEIADKLMKEPLSTTGFAFGFLTGFSERILLPKL